MFQAISLAVIAALTVIDRLTKYAAVTSVKPNGPFKFLFGLFQLRYVENTGAAFSSFSDNTVLLTVFTVLILIVCLVLLMIRRIKPSCKRRPEQIPRRSRYINRTTGPTASG